MKILGIILVLLLSNLSFAANGKEGGNGGDICENKFKIIRDDIVTWIKNGGAAGLKFEQGISLEQYQSSMLNNLQVAHIICTNETVQIGTAEKTCINFLASDGSLVIRCNSDRFLKTSESDQYVLVHHEYAGLSKLEINDGESSDYTLSNQIAEYLENQVVKKLSIKKPAPDLANDKLSVATLGRGDKFVAVTDILLAANTSGTQFVSGDGQCILKYKAASVARKLTKDSILIVDHTNIIKPDYRFVNSYTTTFFQPPFDSITMDCIQGDPRWPEAFGPISIGWMKRILNGSFNFSSSDPLPFP